MNNLFTSTTCAQSIDFGIPAIVMITRAEGGLGIRIDIVDLQIDRSFKECGRLTALMLT